MLAQRLIETAAMMIIGDSVLAMISPRRHVSLWQGGPRWWEQSAEALIEHANVTRALGLAGLSLGLWLAWRSQPPALEGSGRWNWVRRLKDQCR